MRVALALASSSVVRISSASIMPCGSISIIISSDSIRSSSTKTKFILFFDLHDYLHIIIGSSVTSGNIIIIIILSSLKCSKLGLILMKMTK